MVRVTITLLEPPKEGHDWGGETVLYSQQMDKVDVKKIIKAVNDIE